MTSPDPFDEFNTFLRNSRAHAAFWLTHGHIHPEAHHIIVARLTPWIERVAASGAEIRDKLRALVLAPVPSREPEPTCTWIMPAVGSTERERDAEAGEEPEVRAVEATEVR